VALIQWAAYDGEVSVLASSCPRCGCQGAKSTAKTSVDNHRLALQQSMEGARGIHVLGAQLAGAMLAGLAALNIGAYAYRHSAPMYFALAISVISLYILFRISKTIVAFSITSLYIERHMLKSSVGLSSLYLAIVVGKRMRRRIDKIVDAISDGGKLGVRLRNRDILLHMWPTALWVVFIMVAQIWLLYSFPPDVAPASSPTTAGPTPVTTQVTSTPAPITAAPTAIPPSATATP
jgi:hypothetical protein